MISYVRPPTYILASFCLIAASVSAVPNHYNGDIEALQLAEDETLCALQTKAASSASSSASASSSFSSFSSSSASSELSRASLGSTSDATVAAAATEGSNHSSEDRSKLFGYVAAPPAGANAADGAGDGNVHTWLDPYNALGLASDALETFPDMETFVANTGTSDVRLTVVFVNDLPYTVTWTAFDETDGTAYSWPALGKQATPGQMFILQMHASDDGLAGKVRLTDPAGNVLSVAFGSYRVGNFFTGCDKLKIRCMRTRDWDEPYNKMCTTKEAGVIKKDDGTLLISLLSAE